MNIPIEVIATMKTPVLDVGGLIMRMESAIHDAGLSPEQRLSARPDVFLLGVFSALHSIAQLTIYNAHLLSETEHAALKEVFGRFNEARAKLWEKVNRQTS